VIGAQHRWRPPRLASTGFGRGALSPTPDRAES